MKTKIKIQKKKMNKETEFRNFKGIEIRQDDPTVKSRKVCGYAIRFNEPSVYMGFTEIISPEALTQEQVDSADIFCYYNHDTEKVLARSIDGEGTLKLTVDDEGLYYEFEAPNTEIGNELLEHITRGELFGTSFGFVIADEASESWAKDDKDEWVRTINHIDYLLEISPVFSPAYPTTSCESRDAKNAEKIKEMEKTLANLDNLMDDIKNGLKDYNVNIENK